MLEASNEISLVFHAVDFVHSDGQFSNDIITKVPSPISNLSTLALVGNYIHTPTVVFRNTNIEWNNIFNKSPIGDFVLYNLLMENGSAYYIKDKMAIYRYGSGTWSSQTQHFKELGTATAFLCLFTYFLKKENLKIANIYKERLKSTVEKILERVECYDIWQWEGISPEASKLIREIVPLKQRIKIIIRSVSNFIVKCLQLLRML